jgi:hypothetical protein
MIAWVVLLPIVPMDLVDGKVTKSGIANPWIEVFGGVLHGQTERIAMMSVGAIKVGGVREEGRGGFESGMMSLFAGQECTHNDSLAVRDRDFAPGCVGIAR